MKVIAIHPEPTITCDTCQALCCQLEVILMGDDNPPPRYTTEDAWGGTVMRRLDDGWCAALDRNTMRCTIYERRPFLCREYEMGGLACQEERAQGGLSITGAKHAPAKQ